MTARLPMGRAGKSLAVAALIAVAGPVAGGEANPSEAVKKFREQYQQAIAEHGRESAQAVQGLNRVVQALWLAGKAGEPETLQLAEEALAVGEKALGRDHAATVAALNNLASLLNSQGSLERAGELFERSLELRIAKLGPRDEKVALALNNLARNLYSRGDYARAKSLGERALETLEGGNSVVLAAGLATQALLLQDIGDFAEGEKLHARALAIWEEKKGPRSPEAASTLNSLAMLFRGKGEPVRAEEAFARALAIEEALPEADPKELASILNNYGWFKREQQDPGRARELLERALKLREEKLGPEHEDTVWTVRNLAILHGERGERELAARLFDRALRSREKACGPRHPLLAQDLAEWGRFLQASGQTERAVEAVLRAETIAREHLGLTLRALAERLALRYAVVRGSRRGPADLTPLDLALSLAAGGLPPGQRVAVADAAVRSRALVLDEMAARRRDSGATRSPETAQLAGALDSARRRLANLLVRGPGGDAGAYRSLLDQNRKEMEKAEEDLASRSAALRDEAARRRIGWAEVARALEPGSALAGYWRYRDPVRGDAFLALVLAAGAGEPSVVPLGPAAAIDDLVARWREQVSRSPAAGAEEGGYRKAGASLRRKIWDPVAERLAGAERVFVVPDGRLHLVNLASLPVGESDYLVEAGPAIHYLSAERDLAVYRGPPGGSRGGGLLALGGAAFDDESAPLSPAQKGQIGEAVRGGGFAAVRFEFLPSTVAEAEEVVSLWNARAGGEGAELLRGAAAGEKAFKEKAPGRRALHLATHGFFLDGGAVAAAAGTRGIGRVAVEGGNLPPPSAAESPLQLSGLVLAGANRRALAGPDEEDGILTAEEIAGLDLSGMEWAVLSACDTGRGAVQTGEGVLGLRRAFQVAGVRTLILSLWQVEDQSARRWMRGLYQARLTRGLATAEAARAASLEVLRERRAAGRSTHPFYWGGFIAAGDWR